MNYMAWHHSTTTYVFKRSGLLVYPLT
ncbi:hypothetical protein PUN4_1120018 [Paraburkholderia unamae]|nr:hypothetical protein PUN4_1120018 [Paraburkholderia unamae]